MRKIIPLVAGVLCLALFGCADENADYEQKVELTPEQKAQAEQNMAGQDAPGAITPGQPVDAAQMPPGKSGR